MYGNDSLRMTDLYQLVARKQVVEQESMHGLVTWKDAILYEWIVVAIQRDQKTDLLNEYEDYFNWNTLHPPSEIHNIYSHFCLENNRTYCLDDGNVIELRDHWKLNSTVISSCHSKYFIRAEIWF